MTSIAPYKLNMIPMGKRRSKFIIVFPGVGSFAGAYQKRMFRMRVAASTIRPSVTGCLYQGSFSDLGLGVREYTSPLSCSSDLFRAVAREIIMVSRKQLVQATSAM